MAKYRTLKGATPSTRKRDTSNYKFRATKTYLPLPHLPPTKHKPKKKLKLKYQPLGGGPLRTAYGKKHGEIGPPTAEQQKAMARKKPKK